MAGGRARSRAKMAHFRPDARTGRSVPEGSLREAGGVVGVDLAEQPGNDSGMAGALVGGLADVVLDLEKQRVRPRGGETVVVAGLAPDGGVELPRSFADGHHTVVLLAGVDEREFRRRTGKEAG